jgi:predicted DCC family thiol-disulfide oxidoreductase YuxK
MSPEPGPAEILFYDGGCGLCHHFVRFVIRADREGRRFRFAPLGGATFASLVPEAERAALPDSVVVRRADGRLLTRSAAAVHVMRRLGGVWRLLGAALVLVPRPLRDLGYDLVAGARGRVFTKPAEACPVTPPTLRARFDA